MYFLWKRTPHGSIRVSCSGLSGFIDGILSGKSRCRSVALAAGESASVTLVLSSDGSSDGLGLEERIASITAPLGFKVHVIWADRGAPETEWRETLSLLYQSPWTWMLVAAIITLGTITGLKGLFWTLFWSTAAWFVSKFVIGFLIRKKVGSFPTIARR